MKRQTCWLSDDFIDIVQFTVLVACLIAVIFGAAEFLSSAHSAERSACIAAGHKWSSTKYVCVVDLKKK